jgi:hypothetical protein
VLQPDDSAHTWVAQHGGTFSFLIAAHMTFSRVFEDYFEEPADDSGQLVRTAGRRLIDAAAALDDAPPLPDLDAQRLLTGILDRVRRTVALAPDANHSVEVVQLKSRTDADLVLLAERLRAVA